MSFRQWNGRQRHVRPDIGSTTILVVLLVGMSAVAVARPEHLNRWPLGGTRVVCSLDHLVGAGEQRWRRVHGPSILRSEPSIDNLLCFENNCFFETFLKRGGTFRQSGS
jgi:hypothetical protein